MRPGFSLGRAVLYTACSAGLLYTGMRCQENFYAKEDAKKPYSIVQTADGFGVLEKVTSNVQPIIDENLNFQMGSIEYRIQGLLQEEPEQRAKAVKVLRGRLGGGE